MVLIELSVSLRLETTACAPEVRVWLDLEPKDGLASETELPLQAVSAHEWHGTFLADDRCEQFSYRIGVRAHADAEWSVRFRRCDFGTELLVDSDRLAFSKTWLLGQCALRSLSERSELDPQDVRASRRPQLFLVEGGADCMERIRDAMARLEPGGAGLDQRGA